MKVIEKTRQKENFLVLMEHYDKAIQYSQTATNSFGTASEKMGYYQEGIEARTKAMTAAFESLSQNLINSGLVKILISFGTGVLKILDSGFVRFIATLTLVPLATKGIIMAFTALKGSTLVYTASQYALMVATNGLIATTKALWVALSASPLFWVTAIAAGIWGAAKALDKLIVTAKEQKEITTSLISEYDELKGKLTGVNDELKTTNDRIAELNGKDNPTFVEQEELDRLKATNKELEVQRDLLRQQAEYKEKEVADSVKKEYEKEYQTDEQRYYNESGTNWWDRGVGRSTEEDYVKYQIERLSELNDVKLKGISLTEDEQKEYDKLRQSLTAAGVGYADFAERYKIDDETRKNWVDMADLINKALNPESYKTDTFNDVFNSEGFKESKAELLKLSQEGKLDDSVINKYSEFKEVMDNTGLSAKDLAKYINSLNDESTNSSNIFPKVTGSLEDLENKFKDYKAILTDINNGNGLSAKSMVDIIEKYPELIQYLNDETILKQELMKISQDEEGQHKQLIQSKIESNSEFYNNTILTNSDLVDEFSELYGIDLKNYKNLGELKAQIQSVLAGNISTINNDNIKTLASQYGVDLSNFKTVEEQKLAIAKEMVKSMVKAYGVYKGYSYNAIQTEIKELRQRNSSGKYDDKITELEAWTTTAGQDVDSVIAKIDGITSSYVPKSFDIGDFDKKTKTPKDTGVRPDSPDLLKLDIDRYTELDAAINEVTNSINRLRTAREDLNSESQSAEIIASLEEEIRLNEKLAKVQNDKAWEQKKERSDLANFLSLQGFSVTGGFDGTNRVENYPSMLQQMYDRYNAMPYKTDAEKDARTLAKQQIDDIENAYKRIISLNGDVYDTENDIIKLLGGNHKIRKEISDVLADASTNRITDLEHELFLLEKQNSSLEGKINLYDKIKQNSHAEAERLRALGYTEDSSEVQAQQKIWWDADNSILDLRLKNSKEYIDRKNFYDNWGADNEIKAWTRVIDWLKTEYPNAIEEIADAERNLLTAQKDEAQRFYDSAIALTDEEKERLEKLRSAEEDYWDNRISKLKESNEEQEKAITLAELAERLANQRREKVKRVWDEDRREWVYEVDKEAIRDTEREMESLKFDMQITDLEKQREKALETWDKQIKDVEGIQNKWEQIIKDVEKNQQSALLNSLLGGDWKSLILNPNSLDALKAFADKYYTANDSGYRDSKNDVSLSDEWNNKYEPVTPLFSPALAQSLVGSYGINSVINGIASVLRGTAPPLGAMTNNASNSYTEEYIFNGDFVLPNVQKPKDFMRELKSLSIMRNGNGFRKNR